MFVILENRDESQIHIYPKTREMFIHVTVTTETCADEDLRAETLSSITYVQKAIL